MAGRASHCVPGMAWRQKWDAVERVPTRSGTRPYQKWSASLPEGERVATRSGTRWNASLPVPAGLATRSERRYGPAVLGECIIKGMGQPATTFFDDAFPQHGRTI